MTEEKGLDESVAEKIGEYVKYKGESHSQLSYYKVSWENAGREELLSRLLDDSSLMSNASAKQGLEEIKLLFDFLKAYNVLDKASFHLFRI